jgi:UDP-N-acetylmuramoylalanine-D-glutamate ligase
MAATPAKTRATLVRFGADEIVLVCGGELAAAGRRVHDSPEEQAELAATLDAVARVAELVVCFGPAGGQIADALDTRGVRVERFGAVREAVAFGLEHAAGRAALVVSPMYPVALDDRSAITEHLVG